MTIAGLGPELLRYRVHELSGALVSYSSLLAATALSRSPVFILKPLTLAKLRNIAQITSGSII